MTGDGECPVCGSVVRLMAWKWAKQVSDAGETETDRLVRHYRDGSPAKGRGSKRGHVGYDLRVCPGSYAEPGHHDTPHVAVVPPTPKDRSHLREPLPFVPFAGPPNRTDFRGPAHGGPMENPWFMDTYVAVPPRKMILELGLDPLAVDWDEAEDWAWDEHAPMRQTLRVHHCVDDDWAGPCKPLPPVALERAIEAPNP